MFNSSSWWLSAGLSNLNKRKKYIYRLLLFNNDDGFDFEQTFAIILPVSPSSLYPPSFRFHYVMVLGPTEIPL